MITVFTPTYNRAYCLPRLYESLKKQDSKDFEWLIIDDGSTDETPLLVSKWSEEGEIILRHIRTENGGKQRAINLAADLARGEYFFIVDSDDILEPFAISWIERSFSDLPDDDKYIGISGIRTDFEGRLPGKLFFKGYVDASNLQRHELGLQYDMAEVFFTKKIKKYRFEVWPNETFLPEAVVWDQMALDGYILRWYDKGIYRCKYQADGLTRSSWKLLKNNPMGYAHLAKMRFQTSDGLKEKIHSFVTYGAFCFLAGNVKYYFTTYKPCFSLILSPFSFILFLRRKKQLKKYVL